MKRHKTRFYSYFTLLFMLFSTLFISACDSVDGSSDEPNKFDASPKVTITNIDSY